MSTDTDRVILARWQSRGGKYWTEVVRIGDRYQVTADFNTPGKGIMYDSLDDAVAGAIKTIKGVSLGHPQTRVL